MAEGVQEFLAAIVKNVQSKCLGHIVDRLEITESSKYGKDQTFSEWVPFCWVAQVEGINSL